MIERLSKDIIDLPLGSISIPVDRLIAILETFKFQKITAENNDIKFDGLDDIKSHKALLAGFPTIRCDEVIIRLSKYASEIKAYSYLDKNAETIAESLRKELSLNKSFMDKIGDNVSWKYQVLLILVSFIPWLSIRNGIVGKGMADVITLSATGLLTLILAFQFWKGYADMIRKKVTYGKEGGFIVRNIEKIIMMLIGSAITVAATQLSKIIFGQH